MLLHVPGRHPKGKDMHTEKALPLSERAVCQSVDLFDAGIGHGIAAAGYAFAMHQEAATCFTVIAVIGIGKSQIEGKMKAAGGIHLTWPDEVKTFRRAAIPLPVFIAQPFGTVSAYRIAFEQLVAAFLLQPYFQEHSDLKILR